MTHTHQMDKPDTRRRLDDMVQGLVGKKIDRADGPLKVTGTATYAHEWDIPGQTYGVLVRSPFAKGLITGVRKKEIEDMPGVLAVLDDTRFIRNPAQGTANEAPVQGCKKVYYLGQPVALVVAESFEQARHGAQNLELSFQPEDGDFDPEAKGLDTEKPEANQLDQGDLDRVMTEAAHTIDATYHTPGHNSAAMEPHCCIAQWEGEQLTIRASYQMLKFNRNELADALGIPPENVRILSPFVGGGFGSKLGLSPETVAAAIAAKALGQAVSVTLTRPQVFEMVMRRSESRQRIRLAADKTGKLLGLGHEYLVSNLPDEEFSEPVGQATHFTYAAENRRITHEIARINRPCAGSVRAPGEAIGVTAFECAMDELAEACDIDPCDLRILNIPQSHPEQNIPYSSRRFEDCITRGAEDFGWDKRQAKPGQRPEGEWLIGHGMAAAVRVNMLGESEARVSLNPDGTVLIETDMTDIGTGTYTILAQIAGDMLGIPMDKITTTLGDSNLPPSSGSGGSWGAASSGSSVFLACENIRAKIAKTLSQDEAELNFKDGLVTVENEKHALTDILDGKTITATGKIVPGAAGEDSIQSTYGAHFAEVAVNTATGETRIQRMTGVFSAGRILNEKTARSQCIGGMTWGIGMALTEELVHDMRDGHIVNHNLAEYHIPVNLDVPQIDVVFLEERDDWANPMQAKGIGELGICGAAASVINAIYNATGVRVRELPATLDKVMEGLEARETE